jgi:RNA polymerase sigma factor (sigma-70 family)
MAGDAMQSESSVAVDPARRNGRLAQHPGRNSCQTSPTNAQLIARCIDGEFGAWNEVVTRYERLVYAIPLREGLSADDAEEISQAVFETLVQSLHRINQPDRLGHWLMTVTRRLTWRRRTARRSEISVGVELMEPSTGPADPHLERTVDMYDAIATLGEPCRSLIFGLFFDPAEPSYDELARLLGMAVGSIGPLRGRCLSLLRTALSGDAG